MINILLIYFQSLFNFESGEIIYLEFLIFLMAVIYSIASTHQEFDSITTLILYDFLGLTCPLSCIDVWTGILRLDRDRKLFIGEKLHIFMAKTYYAIFIFLLSFESTQKSLGYISFCIICFYKACIFQYICHTTFVISLRSIS